MRVEKSRLVGCRDDLAPLCDNQGIKVAVEIGTDRGTFASDFLRKWRGELLYCVDTWLPYPGMAWDREGDFQVAIHTLAPFGKRVRIVREPSSAFALHLKASTDVPRPFFVYIDGNHEYLSVLEDIVTWWDMIPDGGILAGDDYGKANPGVMRALEEFSSCLGDRVIQLTQDFNRELSWYIHK